MTPSFFLPKFLSNLMKQASDIFLGIIFVQYKQYCISVALQSYHFTKFYNFPYSLLAKGTVLLTSVNKTVSL